MQAAPAESEAPRRADDRRPGSDDRAAGLHQERRSSSGERRKPPEINAVKRLAASPASFVLALVVTACSGFPPELVDTLGGDGPRALDRETVIAGLKEALEVGSERTVERTAVVDGYLANELIRIVMPRELESMARSLRRIGLGHQVDELEEGMNRAAERAAGEAREVLWREIRALTFDDAMEILNGGPTAATDHFRTRTRAEIRARFHPIVVEKMAEVGLSRLYRELADHYNRLPLLTRPAVDLDEYVTDEALAGLFLVLGEEERRIREDPIARTTELLRRVFG